MGTDDLTWGDLLAIVKNLPRTSALYRSQHGQDEYEWDLSEHLLAGIADQVNWLVWSKTSDAAKKPPRNQPKPIPRPGVVDDSKKRIGSGTLPVDQMLSWLGWESGPSLG